VIDPRTTMRRSMKFGGEVIEMSHRKRRIKKTKVVLLCDVSGSMGLLQPVFDPVHVRSAERAVGRRDFRFQYIA
jgi:uncharacterized protein with von Willebrand factor type A (vWA) domain